VKYPHVSWISVEDLRRFFAHSIMMKCDGKEVDEVEE
jgi:hypothetical protein